MQKLIKNRFIRFYFFFALVFIPLQAKAIIPALIWGASVLAEAAGSAAASVGWMETSVAIHAAIAAIVFNKTKDNSTVSTPPLRIELNPNTPLITPTGWTPPTPENPYPTPPILSSNLLHVISVNGVDYSDADKACNALYLAGGNNAYGPLNPASVSGDTVSCSMMYQGQVYPFATLNYGYKCPSGYTKTSDTTCQLTDPNLVARPADGQCQVTRSGNTWRFDTSDPDCSDSNVLEKMSIFKSSDNKDLTVSDTNSGSQVTIHLNDDGSGQIQSQKPVTVDNQPYTQKQTIDFQPTTSGVPEVIGSKTEEIPGQGSLAAPSGSSSSGNTLDISSLNKEATQQSINSKLSSIDGKQCGYDSAHPCEVKLQDDGETDSTQTLDDKKAADDALFNEHLGHLDDYGNADNHGINALNPAEYFPSSECFPLTYTALGHTYILDACPYQGMIKQVLGYVLYVLTAGTLFGMFLRQPHAGTR